jgi:periplasmic protein TonB
VTAALPSTNGQWTGAAAVALALHVACGLALLMTGRIAMPPVPEPVMIVELPPLPAAPEPVARETVEPVAQPVQAAPVPVPQIQAPVVAAPLPRDPVVVPQPVVQPRAVEAPAAPPAPRPVAAAPTEAPVSDARAKKQEADYYALLSAHLNRKKIYPAEAKRARQQGVVAVRFTVDRSGGVSNSAIRRSSGHAILDQATLALMQRVSPLPAFPRSMPQASVSITLPIQYSLTTD